MRPSRTRPSGMLPPGTPSSSGKATGPAARLATATSRSCTTWRPCQRTPSRLPASPSRPKQPPPAGREPWRSWRTNEQLRLGERPQMMTAPDLSPHSVLVTGAAGFIGFHLAQRLLAAGATVHGIDNLNSYYDVDLKRARLAQLRAHQRFAFAAPALTHYHRRKTLD